jgi:hypothetical protein
MGADALMDLGGNMGVVEMEGRLKAAGSMSGIVNTVAPEAAFKARLGRFS